MKKSAMNGTLKDLKAVIAFLNDKPFESKPRYWVSKATPTPDSPDARRARAAAAAQELQRTRDEKAHDLLRFELTNILAPGMLVPRTWDPKARDKQNKFFNRIAPRAGLVWLIHQLNGQAKKPRWGLEETIKGSRLLKIPGFTGRVVKQEFTHPAWQAVANLLQSADILRIGRCAICEIFFLKNRFWQKACEKQECRRKYDNQQSADRKAKLRRRNKQLKK